MRLNLIKSLFGVLLITIFVFLTGCSSVDKKESEKTKLNEEAARENTMVSITGGSISYSDIKIEIKPFYISKYKVNNKEFNKIMDRTDTPNNVYPRIGITYREAIDYCNKLSVIEGLNPYYDTSGKIKENPLNNGYRLPTKEEYFYIMKHENDNEVLFSEEFNQERLNGIIKTYKNNLGIEEMDYQEYFNEDIVFQNKKEKKYFILGFRIVKNNTELNTTLASNTYMLKYTTTEDYEDNNLYEPFENKRYGITLIKPKSWGIRGIIKGKNPKKNNDSVDNLRYEIGNVDEESQYGVVFYKSIYDNKRIFQFSLYAYENVKINVEETIKGKKGKSKTKALNEKDIIKSFANFLQIDSEIVHLFAKDKMYFFFWESEKKNEFFMYIYNPNSLKKNLYEIRLECINSITPLPKELKEKIFGNIKFRTEVEVNSDNSDKNIN